MKNPEQFAKKAGNLLVSYGITSTVCGGILALRFAVLYGPPDNMWSHVPFTLAVIGILAFIRGVALILWLVSD